MKTRKVYYRKKGKSIVIEGKRKNKTIYIFTLPKPEKLLDALMPFTTRPLDERKKPSILTKEKIEKIKTILASLDFKKNKNENYD